MFDASASILKNGNTSFRPPAGPTSPRCTTPPPALQGPIRCRSTCSAISARSPHSSSTISSPTLSSSPPPASPSPPSASSISPLLPAARHQRTHRRRGPQPRCLGTARARLRVLQHRRGLQTDARAVRDLAAPARWCAGQCPAALRQQPDIAHQSRRHRRRRYRPTAADVRREGPVSDIAGFIAALETIYRRVVERAD